MTVTVTQFDNEAASQAVTIYADGERVGVIGPGESLTIKRDHISLICAECGVYNRSISVDGDVSLQVRWNSMAQDMDLTPVRNL